MKRRRLGILVLLGVLVVAAIVGWHIHRLLQSGQPVFWLEELWAPAGLLSIGLVSGLDFLIPAPSTGSGRGPAGPRVKARGPKVRR